MIYKKRLMKLIEPKILKGTRDFGPKEMAQRLSVINTMRTVFERFGYDPIETPAIEYAQTILGKYGEEGDKLTYTFEDKGGRKVALRYDQTVPTARFVAANWSSLTFPFKRYQIGPVWRADKPQRGRYREFYQCDIDIIGTDSLVADAEIAKTIYQVFSSLEMENILIRVNSRKVMNDLLDLAKIKKADRIAVIRLIDKLDKVPLKKIKKELENFLKPAQVEKLDELILSEKIRNDLSIMPEVESRKELVQLFELYKQLGIPEENITLDLTLARGLDYYTGVTYEVVIPESGLGSICGGGRYDDLTSIFTAKKFPGVGVAFGLDRIMVYLEEQKQLENISTNTQLLVANFADTQAESIELTSELQEAGINTEFYLQPDKLQKQFKYADKKDIPYIILQGSEEVASKKVLLRNMKTGEQKSMTLKQVLKTIN